MRNLVLVLGDQLSHDNEALVKFDPSQDSVWMAEVDEEATKVWCHKTRLVFFFSAMRHFRDELEEKDFPIEYHELTPQRSKDKGGNFGEVLAQSLRKFKPEKVIVAQPGDWFVQQELQQTCDESDVELEIVEDTHFYCTIEDFREWSQGRKTMVLEHFYRSMRKKHQILMEGKSKPVGGEWNFDKENRKTFDKGGPKNITPVAEFAPDETTKEVMAMVEKRFADHPGECESFSYPVTAEQATESLEDFIENRLPNFGDYQDAMWSDTEFLNHSRISAVLNAHLLDPAIVVQSAVDAYENGAAPINSVEGFVRQVIGWREYVRGVYWTQMPGYIERNALECEQYDVPKSFWDGETEMNCVRQAMQPVLKHSYAHHIQRLMVLGLYAQLLGVHPRKFHDWHMAMYADAIDWVSLPNTLGMSQHADGAVVGTKPYCASGNYIDRMSNYCKGCAFKPKEATGDKACPVTTLYWDFLDRHRDAFADNGRMTFQMKNLENKSEEVMEEIRKAAAAQIKAECG
ncbi:MAG: cryptochrome/photolyase family protein [Pirellulaceae bacterium]